MDRITQRTLLMLFTMGAFCSAQIINFYQIAGKEFSPSMSPNLSYQSGAPWKLQWVPRSNGEKHPFTITGGLDLGNKRLHVARFRRAGELIPGKLSDAYTFGHFPLDEREEADANYELLVAPRESLSWVETSRRKLPLNAVQGGNDAQGKPLYIARAELEGTVTCGLVDASGHAKISFAGQVHTFTRYEILVLNLYGRAIIHGFRNATARELRSQWDNGTFAMPSNSTKIW